MLRRHSIAHRVTLNSTLHIFNLEYCKIDNAHFRSFFFVRHLLNLLTKCVLKNSFTKRLELIITTVM